MCASAGTHAAGYAVGQESIVGAGAAHAGGAAGAVDASTVQSNPAGMSTLIGAQATVGAALIFPNVDYDERGSVLATGGAVTGGEGGNGGQAAAVPSMYFVSAPYGRFRFGLGLNSPFGLVTKYDFDWLGRYSEITTSLKTFNLNPSVSVDVNDWLSVGAGFNVQRVRAKLLQAIDFGSICVANLGGAACNGAFGLAPQNADGTGYVSGWDWGVGYNFGLLAHLTPQTRVGLHYRSHIHYAIELDADFGVPTAARNFLTAAGQPNAFTDGQARTQLDIPEMASISVQHSPTDRWQLQADLTWTRWTQFEQLRVEFVEPTTPANVLRTRWNDVLRLSAGAHYRWNDRWWFRGGVAFDESPIDTEHRGPGVPDSDRFVAALGASYRVDDTLSVDFAYQHLFFVNAETRRLSATNSRLIGSFDVDVDVVGIGVTWRF